MLNKVEIRNFGPLKEVNWSNLGRINLVIGDNRSGKTFLLKLLYCYIRMREEYKRGNDPRNESAILLEKLFWTFQADSFVSLVTHGEKNYSCVIGSDDVEHRFSSVVEADKNPTGTSNIQLVTSYRDEPKPRLSNSVFLPAKEVLSLYYIIFKSRDIDKVFGFDDTYLDLARALQPPLPRVPNGRVFSEPRKELEDLIGGRVELSENPDKGWYFITKDGQTFPMGVTAEGVKKVGILDRLLGNGYLDKDSIIFIDEPEAALHPTAISKLLDIIAMLAETGIQFFLASHSYFVVKKLHLIALKKKMSIPILSSSGGKWLASDLQKELPNNPIIDESIKLYREEVELALPLP